MPRDGDIARVLILPLNYDHDQGGQVGAFRYLFGPDNVTVFDYLARQREGASPEMINDALLSFIDHHRGLGWIWMQLQETEVINADTLRAVKATWPRTTITHWTGDYRPSVSPYLASICQATDVTFISSIGQIPLFESAGAKEVRYLQVGLDWNEDVLGIPNWAPPFKVPDVVFCGNHYGDRFPLGTSQRLEVIRALQDAKVDVGVVGSGWPEDVNVVGACTVKQQHHVYTRAKVVLSINHINDVENYYSDRHLIGLASGTPVAAWAVPGLNGEFVPGWDHVAFSSAEEAVKVVKDLLRYPDQARKIGLRGRRCVRRRHGWLNRIVSAWDTVEELRQR